MSKAEQVEWHLRRGHYLGEISALCFLHLPPHLSSLPFLLAGTGSQILVYDLVSGKMINSFQVFDGIRVHGITLECYHRQLAGSAFALQIAIFGERRVKLFNLQIEQDNQQFPCFHLELTLIHSLPKVGHWVLDVCFLKDGATSSEGGRYLAIGCSDNSVCFWDILRRNVFSDVKSSERCLLYSMRMWGDEVESLLIASGTIFNEIIVWKVVSRNHATALGSPVENKVQLIIDVDFQLPVLKYEDVLISRLVGHEGSIFRIAWFPNGLKLVSVSDDRSARIWEIQAEKASSYSLADDSFNHLTGPVLFGHNARIWDCCIYDSLIITAGEDCTCRVWDHDGRELNMIREHIGRGIWRCLYDPHSSLLVTAGFDSAIKVRLHKSSKGLELSKGEEAFIDKKETFALRIPNSCEHVDLMDSKSEYVRCLHFSREDSLYVATNKGYLYHVGLFDNGAFEWTELVRISEGAPIICMDLLSNCSNFPDEVEDWVAVGDGKGSMAIVQVVCGARNPKVEFVYTWSAEKERHLLGTYWCKSLGNRFIFTVSPGGSLKLWRLGHSLQSASLSGSTCPIAEFVSCFGMRIMCMDASFDEEVLVCGDIRGNLILFSLPRVLLSGVSVAAEVQASPMNYFKGAHGISSVCSVSIVGLCSGQVEIHSTGADGCICYLQHDRDLLNLEFIGMKQAKELSAVRSIFSITDCSENSAVGNYAVGFASSNFIIWNLTAENKVIQISCGGWRRPHSYYLGDVPEMKNCFAFVKDDIIHVHRRWVTENERQTYPQNLHLQFHGREIHSLCFISGHSLSSSEEEQGFFSGYTWIATGCEDGTVRLTGTEPGKENWLTSKLLGEHVGGSAVRSICSVAKIYIFRSDLLGMPNEVCRQNATLEERDIPFILISVGAKRVVTAWKQIIRTSNKRVETGSSSLDNKHEKGLSSSSATMPLLSFQWLSTDMPSKSTSYAKRQNTKEVFETAENACIMKSNAVSGESLFSEYKKMDHEDKFENDWRYLAVTAFLVKVAESRISVCFVIVACSDATVTVRALVLPYRLWFDVASLAPLSSPVLALQHVVVPKFLPSKGNVQIGSLYTVISGSTDGSIAFWDLTECVGNFMQRISTLKTENYIEFQKRPRTGRGSQGGRWWRSINSHNLKKKPGGSKSFGHHVLEGKFDTGFVSMETAESSNEMQNHMCTTFDVSFSEQRSSPVSPQVSEHSSLVLEEKRDDSSSELSAVAAIHVLNNVHQSGVNCLCVSDIKDSVIFDSGFSFYVLSGGDDQALSCLRCDLEINHTGQNSENFTAENHCTTSTVNKEERSTCCQIQNHQIKFLSLDKVNSAHSSAVKGVWSDGRWVFSTGLDQRVRCWNLDRGRLVERANLVISVPEPEALDVKACGRNYYLIAIAGRGIQMVEFFPSSGMDSGE
ncbi:Transducin family protein/WD-40 repeat family protein [Forsythia ovata]|uniref:Transducin family protein/WD-40 repeat family protein n=1 Tax=Forsythia ovata TaxID=205694 RepID=A0ABD1VDA3_9LAMI